MKVEFTLKEEPEPFSDRIITHCINLGLSSPVSINQKRKAVANKLGLGWEEVEVKTLPKLGPDYRPFKEEQ